MWFFVIWCMSVCTAMLLLWNEDINRLLTLNLSWIAKAKNGLICVSWLLSLPDSHCQATTPPDLSPFLPPQQLWSLSIWLSSPLLALPVTAVTSCCWFVTVPHLATKVMSLVFLTVCHAFPRTVLLGRYVYRVQYWYHLTSNLFCPSRMIVDSRPSTGRTGLKTRCTCTHICIPVYRIKILRWCPLDSQLAYHERKANVYVISYIQSCRL
jgi:hypothetical protein